MAVGLVFLITTSLTLLAVPQVVRFAVDEVVERTSSSWRLLQLAGLLLGLAVTRSVARAVYRLLLFGASRRMARDIRRDFYAHVVRLPVQFFERKRIGELMAISSNDVDAVRRLLGWGLLLSLDTLVMVGGAVFFMADLSREVTLYAFLPMAAASIFFTIIGPRIRHMFRLVQESFAALTVDAEENITGVRVVRAYVQEEGEKRKFAVANSAHKAANMKMVAIDGLFQAVMALLPSLPLAAILLVGGPQVVRGQLSLGSLLAIFLYAREMRWPIRFFGAMFNMIQRGRASAARIWDVFREDVEFGDEVAPERIESLIRIRDLTFRYPGYGARALDGVTLQIDEGQTVALMGRTGAGKSTILNLLLRLYDPPRGTIFLGGIDILDIPKGELRELCATAPQDAFLFTDSIRGNISFTLEYPVEEELIRVAESVHLHDDIMQMPQKYATVVGERGITLSGGQRQRASLARAFLAGRPILLLDDPLSAVDTITEAGILRAIDRERDERTVLLVTNRVNAARMADRIVVLDKGRIVEQGTEQQLLLLGGVYAEIHRRQQFETPGDHEEQP